MCGNHSSDGSPIGHHHGPKRIYYPRPHPASRRAFLGNFGKGTVAMAVLSPTLLAACSSDGGSEPTATAPTAGAAPTTAAAGADPTAVPETAAPEATAPAADPNELEPVVWARALLGSVSAYVLARGNTAAIVDTGVSGSAAAIGETLATLGLNYSDVAHVILTHNHPDHAGSIGAVLAEAVNATAYVGEADLDAVPGDLTAIAGGEDIFGFEMVATPGHTAGHMAVFDPTAGLLVAGDALFSEGGGVVEGPERFFADIPQSRQSIAALAELSFETLLVGHGDPIESGADSAVAALAASFG